MSERIAYTSQHNPARFAGFVLEPDKALKAAAKFWFLMTIIGQWIFVYYILAYYGVLTWQGGVAAFAETHLPGGYIAGDTVGNFAVVSHVFLAVIVTGFGSLQLVPQIRARFPAFHRWNGRVFMTTAVVISIAGLYMTWIRAGGSSLGNFSTQMGVSISGVLVLIFAALALRYAIARDIKTHRRWALRLFMVVSTVWFSRLMLWGWVLLTGGVGIDFKTFTGPTLVIVNFAQWIVPLAVLELYLRTQENAGARGKLAMAAGLFVLTLLMGAGIVGATKIIWLPKI
jgi:hypothetical protein